MSRIEQRLTHSLRERAGDVEPTPALWREVTSRATARTRWRRVRWGAVAATAATAVLAAVAVVPTVLDDGPEVPPVVDEPPPSPGEVPDTATIVDGDGVVHELDLDTQERVPSGSDAPGTAGDPLSLGPVTDLDQPLDSRGFVAAVTRDDELAVVSTLSSGPTDRATAPLAEESPAASLALSPDGDHVAWLRPDGEDGIALEIVPVGTDVLGEEPRSLGELGLDADGLPRLAAWVDDGTGADGEVWLVGPEQEGVRTVPVPEAGDAAGAGRVDAVAGDRAVHDLDVVERGGQRTVWRLQGDRELVVEGAVEGSVALPDGMTDGGPTSDWWLDARGDAALVGDGRDAWLLPHDGTGRFLEAQALEDVARGALHAPGRATGDAGEGDAADGEDAGEGDAADGDQGPSAPEAGPDDGAGGGGALPLVATDGEVGSHIVLLDGATGDTWELADLDVAGESSIEALAVRPGSTRDDLTVALLARAEGRYDLRILTAGADGASCCDPLPEEVQVDAAAPLDDEHSLPRPVWSSDGDTLAWVESGGGAQWLRTVAWDERAGAPDPDAPSTGRLDISAVGVDRPVVLDEWVTEAREREREQARLYLTGTEMDRSALMELPLHVGEGAPTAGDDFRLLGTEIPRVAATHVGTPGEATADHIAERAVVEWEPGVAAWLRVGRDRGGIDLPVGYRERLDDGRRPWLTPSGGELVTGVGDVAYRIDPEGGVTALETGGAAVAFADAVE